jgi:hypothetical protein
MGTELGLGDYVTENLESSLSSWMLPEATNRGGDDDDGDDEALEPDDGLVADEQEHFVFPFALMVAGMLHIIHNLEHKAHSAMENWEWFIDGIKLLVTLLHQQENRDILIQKCIRNSCLAHLEFMVTMGIPKVIEWRWGVVVEIVERLLPLRTLLRICFKPQVFNFKQRGRAEDDDPFGDAGGAEGPERASEGKFDPVKLQEYIRSELFWALC